MAAVGSKGRTHRRCLKLLNLGDPCPDFGYSEDKCPYTIFLLSLTVLEN